MEILAGGPNGEFIPSRPEAVARILADDNEVSWFEFFTPEGPVRLPLYEIEQAIAAGKLDVHGEAWYDKQVPGRNIEISGSGSLKKSIVGSGSLKKLT